MPEPRKDWNSDAMAMATGTYLEFWARVGFADVVVVYSPAEKKRSPYEMTSSMPDAGRQVILRVQPKEGVRERTVAWMKLEATEPVLVGVSLHFRIGGIVHG